MKGFLVCLLFIFSRTVWAQTSLETSLPTDQKPIKILTLGGVTGGLPSTSCEVIIGKKYGITYKYMHGCVLTKWRKWRINSNFRQADKRLTKRIGKDWEERYMQEVQACKQDE
ncbi:hypothetical protein Q0590_35215 [Rhodocytophaga aerolata]|uniref:DUF4294 domain-containing protein n=1 Tax=Rhodocytophaga aerolata TaxID=455078 RepID=A0ABT8RHJ6_9BACT|nr:hypothetical protein [Rhodocytophaga aerolata]MDO1451576.1 hypothetical protein [Rhodocytophaga aerolata]